MIPNKIDSPFTNGKAVLNKVENTLKFRNNDFKIIEHFYVCEETKKEFTSNNLDELNLNQVYNQYRDKYGLPFPDQIKKIREKYGVSALKMSEILGFGANTYRLYENGEVPSVGNGRLILAADDPTEFYKFLLASEELIKPDEFVKLKSRILKLIEHNEGNKFKEDLFKRFVPDQYTGYKMPDIEKISHIILFFSQNAGTWITKLNKLLFYTDFIAFKNSGFGISGLDYRAINYGPVPTNYDLLFYHLDNEDLLKRVVVEEIDYEGSFFSPKATFDSSLFSEFELSILETVSKKFYWCRASEIKEISHKELAWKENKDDKRIISYKDYAFSLNE